MTTRIPVADDSHVVRQGIRHLLRQHEGFEVCGDSKRSGRTSDDKSACPGCSRARFCSAWDEWYCSDAARFAKNDRPSQLFCVPCISTANLWPLARDVGMK